MAKLGLKSRQVCFKQVLLTISNPVWDAEKWIHLKCYQRGRSDRIRIGQVSGWRA